MPLALDIKSISYPTLTPFRISRSTVKAVNVIQLTLDDDTHIGRGECRPYPRYNQTPESIMAEIEAVRLIVESGDIETALSKLTHCRAAQNALESAWVDIQAKTKRCTAAEILGVKPPTARQTAFTLSWGSAEEMTIAARDAAQYPWLKIKIGENGLPQVLAVAEARPDARLIIDANEALTEETLASFLQALSGLNIALIEQPLPAGHTNDLPETDLVICADEGLHNQSDLPQLWAQGYRAVNVKLDKCGGPIAARRLILEAKAMGFTVMAGCMVGSSLAMAPMVTLESLCDIIDLDGALLLAEDISHGLVYEGSLVHPPSAQLWG
jgi:L-alanine-DL-glutamate epimerase-like enolase superfamily enzyme